MTQIVLCELDNVLFVQNMVERAVIYRDGTVARSLQRYCTIKQFRNITDIKCTCNTAMGSLSV